MIGREAAGAVERQDVHHARLDRAHRVDDALGEDDLLGSAQRLRVEETSLLARQIEMLIAIDGAAVETDDDAACVEQWEDDAAAQQLALSLRTRRAAAAHRAAIAVALARSEPSA